MKKLMIAAAIVCAAAFAQAGAVNWYIYNVTDPANESLDLAKGTAYLFHNVEGTLFDDVIASLSDVSTFKSTYIDTDKYAYSSVIEEGSLAELGAVTGLSGDQWFYTVYFDTEDITKAGNYGYVDPVKQSLPGTSGGKSYNFYHDSWNAVPEPTSGLLLLIGVAGLALRRRRA